MARASRGRAWYRAGALAAVGGIAVLSLPALVAAGPSTTQANGNFLMIDVNVTPPRADSGATISYHAFFGNRKGAVLPREALNEIHLAKGFRLGDPAFATCPLPRQPSEVGEERCSPAAKVGTGTFEADARPALAEPVSGTLQAYNGDRRGGRRTLILLAEAKVGTSTLRSEVDYQYVGSTLRSLPPPEGTVTGLYSVTKVSLRLGARRQGKSYVRTPRSCGGSWRFRETSFFEGGGSITARDAASCTRR